MQNSKWIEKSSLRYHLNDVNSICVTGNFFLSGSIDTRVFIYPLDKFDNYSGSGSNHSQNKEMINFSKKSRMFTYIKDSTVEIYSLSPPLKNFNGFLSGDSVNVDYNPLISIKSHDSLNITCSAINKNSTYVAYSTVNEIKLYTMKIKDQGRSIHLFPFGTPELLKNLSAEKMMFVSEGNNEILVFVNNEVNIYSWNLTTNKKSKVNLTHLIHPNQNIPSHKSLGNSIYQLTSSGDGKWIACSDVCGNVFVFDNTLTLHHRIINFENKTLIHLSFNTNLKNHSSTPFLHLLFHPLDLVIYDIEKKCEYDWKKERNFSRDISKFRYLITGICFNPSFSNRIYFHGSGYMGFIDYTPENPTILFEMRTDLDGIVQLCFFDSNELAMIKRTWKDIQKTLPVGFVRKKYN